MPCANPASGRDVSSYNRVVFCGSRGAWSDLSLVLDDVPAYVGQVLAHFGLEPTVILSGTADGADAMGEQWAKRKSDVEVEQYPGWWDDYPRQGGMIRNAQMALKADAVVALWDGQSPGTSASIEMGRHILGNDAVFVHEYRDGLL